MNATFMILNVGKCVRGTIFTSAVQSATCIIQVFAVNL